MSQPSNLTAAGVNSSGAVDAITESATSEVEIRIASSQCFSWAGSVSLVTQRTIGSSAGTVDYPHVVRPYTREYLLSKGYDVSGHARCTLTRAIMDESDLVVAISTDHQATILERFGREVPLYLEICGEAAAWIPRLEAVLAPPAPAGSAAAEATPAIPGSAPPAPPVLK